MGCLCMGKFGPALSSKDMELDTGVMHWGEGEAHFGVMKEKSVRWNRRCISALVTSPVDGVCSSIFHTGAHRR